MTDPPFLTYRATSLVLLLSFTCQASPADIVPWQIATAASLPKWLSVSGTHRARYESLDGQFRSDRAGNAHVLVLRTLLLTELKFDTVSLGVELMDSRAEFIDADTTVNPTVVNPLELLQAYLSFQASDVLRPGDSTELRVGRITMDVGDRRLVARNRYRNTLNNFTGIEWNWNHSEKQRLKAFYVLPIKQQPTERDRLLVNDIEFDAEYLGIRFWGLYGSVQFSSNLRAEIFLFGLDESDETNHPTRNRELYTPGARLYMPPEPSRFDFTIESVWQIGESRASTATTDVQNLQHFAHFQHVEFGYTFNASWVPRLVFQYDYASGDKNPADRDNERFDTLFGARRFDFGPTGIYGPFARSNSSTPGVRLQFSPSRHINLFVAHRAYWLASAQDEWTTSGLRDSEGRSGNFIGQQIETRLRWEIVPGNYRFEAGLAHFFSGNFKDDAPNSNGEEDATYFYFQVLLSF